jgi:Tol biopolymer transport system component
LIRGSTFQTRRLTRFGDLDGRVFALSPDGGRLLFTRTITESDRLNELWLVSTAEASPESVTLDVEDVLWADWSPDGDQIAWTTAEPTESVPGWRGLNDLLYARVTGSGALLTRRELLEPEAGGGYGWWGTRYRWAPDGGVLAFSRPESVGGVDVASGEQSVWIRYPPYRTYSSWAWNPDLGWSSDADLVALPVHVAGTDSDPEESPVFNLVALNIGGTYSATLVQEVGMWANPRFSPDGETLLIGRAIVPYQSATSAYTLHLLDRDGSNQRHLYGSADDGLTLPIWTWSPDGRSVAFIRLGDVYRLEVASGVLEPLTNEGGVTQVVWR